MYQFTDQEIVQLRIKSKEDSRILEWLTNQTHTILDSELKVPRTGIANWTLYYYCSNHSVPLEFDINKPTEHRCPIDGEILTGEPYDSAWWGHMNHFNMQGAYYLGLLYLLTEDLRYADKVKQILLEYATYYPNYEVHGNIPYNHPGRIGAQALDEAVFTRNMAYAYDLIEETLTADEKAIIRDNFFIESAEFLKEQRTKQLHNHEVIINAAIGVVGILFNRKDLCDFALYTPYGLVYQLEKGVLEDKFWFEGALSYHFYALQSFFAYEKFARHTQYSQLTHPNYREMISMVLDLLQPGYTFPLLNDASLGNAKLNGYNLFEFAYSVFKDEKILQILHKIYETEERNNLETFFYGVEKLPVSKAFKLENFHSDKGSGLTVLRGKDERYLLFKHSPFGGEHDHYDRLGISYLSHGKRVAPDLGTTGYGASLHYEYFKNTGTHNTVVINEENHAPAECQIWDYQENSEGIYIDAGVDWQSAYTMPDSFTIKQWDEESYKAVNMRRKILWLDHYFIEVFIVNNVKDHTIDWVTHIVGKRQKSYTEKDIQCFSTKKPFKYLKDIRVLEKHDIIKTVWKLDDIDLQIFSYTKGLEIFYGVGPDNPSVSDVSYMIQRQRGHEAVFVNVWESYRDDRYIEDVEMQVDQKEVRVTLITKQGKKRYSIPL